MAEQTVRPQNRREFMDKLVKPYDPKLGNPNQIFSEPTKLGQPEINRAKEISVKGEKEKDFSIGIKDIDEAVNYYFNNVLRLSVVQNNTRLNVPIIYGTPENWKSIQLDGYYRDEGGKMMAPLLMFKRKSVTQNRNLGFKLDGNVAHNLQTFETSFTKKNFYSNFKVLNSRAPEKKYIVSVTPDYVTVEYECILWTYFVEQMDKLIESVNFASRSYWGDPSRFQFYSSIESFEDSITYAIGENRAVRTNFNLTLNGYLIPDSINKALSAPNMFYSVSKVVFGLETADSSEEYSTRTKASAKSKTSKPVSLTDSQNIVNNINITNNNDFDPALAQYLGVNKSVTGTVASLNSVAFANAWLTAPSPLPATSVNNFTFFVNGQYVEPTSIVSFTTNGSTSALVVNTTALGYSLESSDIVIASGKFS
jgi:hypothetical protein